MNSINYNPDVLDAIANLSSDEVFTPPKVVNDMLDMLPQELFKDPNSTFLDPVSKSGVFLREIAKRLMRGLEEIIPDRYERANHILKNQLFGIAITELTSLISRRTLYGTKIANSKYSFCTEFETKEGNILFNNIKHTWKNEKCIYCGANKKIYDRGNSLESYAYEFIHTKNPKELFGMKFDVIIGNPPYQIKDSGAGASAKPIYHLFVQQAKKLNPRYLVMIIPARWYNGGKGLDEFRKEMLNDNRIREIHDFPNTSDCFPGLNIRGGVCYFLWDNQHSGKCEIYNYRNRKVINYVKRDLLEKDLNIFIRNNNSISILRKIRSFKEKSFADIISSNDPFGFDIREDNSYKRVKLKYELKPFKNSIVFYYNGWKDKGKGYIDKNQIRKNIDLIDSYKILFPKAWGKGDSNDWLKPFIAEPNSCCTETYLMIAPVENLKIAENIISYMQTKFFHFLVSLIKNTQNAMKKVYSFVPMQDFTQEWTDEKLYKKYNLTQEEIDFIESMIKPME